MIYSVTFEYNNIHKFLYGKDYAILVLSEVMEITKRKVLRGIGASTAVHGGIRILSARSRATQGQSQDEPKPTENFGIVNNSTSEQTIPIKITDGINPLYERQFTLHGRNNPESSADDSQFRGLIEVDTDKSGTYQLVAKTSDGKRASSPIRIERGGISNFAYMSVYYWHDDSLQVLTSTR